MSGRHRQAQTTGPQRMLAGTVPVLGLVGLVAATTGAGSETTETADTADATTARPTAAPLAAPADLIGQPAASDAGLTGVAATAATAVGQTGETRREQERRALLAVVADVQADARDREAAAAALGRGQLDAFRAEVENQRKPAPEPTAPARIDHIDHIDHGDHDDGDRPDASCDLSGLARTGDRADPDEIVGRDCGLLDLFGSQRSADPWIDGQLLSARGD